MTEPTPGESHLVDPSSRLDRILARIPGLLASKAHQLFLVALGVWLVMFPLVPGLKRFAPSAQWMLIGGNWTNVSSALGACIAAGAGLAIHREVKQRRHLEELRHEAAMVSHALVERAHEMVSDLHALHIGDDYPKGPTP